MPVKWPSFILTTACHLLYVRSDGTYEVLHTGNGLYYSSTWDDRQIYVAHRKGFRSQHPEISILDSDYQVRGCVPGDFPDVHQIYYSGGSLYAMVTALDSVAVWDGAQTVYRNWTGHDVDTHHMNSIWGDGEHFWVCYHNAVTRGEHPSSNVVKVDRTLQQVVDSFEVGKDIHCSFVLGDKLFVGNSGAGELMVLDIETRVVEATVPLGMWTRGLACTDTHLVVGASVFAERRDRIYGHGKVCLLDRETLAVLDERVFPDVGAVCGLRVTDTVDYAHNGVRFPGRLL